MEAPCYLLKGLHQLKGSPGLSELSKFNPQGLDLAIYILNTKPIEEASRIFTQGLQPVVSAACRMGSNTRMDMDSGEELELSNLKDIAQEAPAAAFRDIASAPF